MIKPPDFCICESKGTDQLCISTFVFTTRIVQFLFYLQRAFFNSCHLLDYFSCGLTTRMLFICGESSIFSDQISIKIVALRRTTL